MQKASCIIETGSSLEYVEGNLKSITVTGCPVCRGSGRPLYQGLQDKLFNVSGAWGFRLCETTDCGVVWLDPRPAPEDLHLAYENYYTHASVDGSAGSTRIKKNRALWERLVTRNIRKLAKFGIPWYRAKVYGDTVDGRSDKWSWLRYLLLLSPSLRAEIDFTYMYMKTIPRGRILEVGCGGGWLLRLFERRGWSVQGVDFDPMAVQQARSLGLAVQCGDLLEQDYPAESFDAIVGSHVIEHLSDPESFFREALRLLKPGGQLVLVTPNPESLGHALFGSDWRGLEPPRHLQIFTGRALVRLAGKVGFDDCRVKYSIRDADHIFQSSYNIRVKGSHSHGERSSGWLRSWTRSLQMLEWLMMRFRPALGEELAVIVRKGGP